MKKTILLFILFTNGFLVTAQISSIIGKWKTIDEKNGNENSIVTIFKATNGKYYGRVDKIFKFPDIKCTECVGLNKNKPILGMLIINNMLEKDGKLTGGTIVDPENGKVYKCIISIHSSDNEKLEVRGSLDKSGWIGRSQIWNRSK